MPILTAVHRLLLGAMVALSAIAVSPLISSAILVAPHALFIDHRSRTAQFTLANSSEQAEEVEVELKFGYPATDSLGRPYIKLFDAPGSEHPSAAEWIRAFPRRVRLEPGQRQVVRLLATPPVDLADREYWSRIIVTSRRSRDQGAAADSGLRAGLTLELRTITALIYRKGRVHTGVTMHDARAEVAGDSLTLDVDLEREGNAAYLGSFRVSLEDAAARTIREWRTSVAVYYSLQRRMKFPLTGVAPGPYRVTVELSTAREDIPQFQVLPAPPIVRSFEIEVT